MIDFFKNNIDYLKKFIFGVLLIVVYKTFDNLASIFHSVGVIFDAAAPFFAALIIAYMLNLPVVKLAELIGKIKYKIISEHAYGISVLIVYILSACIIGITISALVPALYQNLLEFTVAFPDYLMNVFEKLSNIDAVQRMNFPGDMISIDSAMKSLLNMFDAKQIGSYIGQVFSVTSGLITVFIAVIGSVYMLLDKKNIIKGFKKLVSIIFKTDKAESIMGHASRVNVIFTKYIYCRLLCSIICGTVCGIVLSIMRVKYAAILAIFIGAMDMIPYFGSIFSYIIALLITLLTGGVWQTIWVAVALLIIQQLDGNLLAPKLMGESLELRPLWIVVAVFVGGKLFGFLGMLLSVPVLAVVKTIAEDYIQELEEKRSEAANAEMDDWEDFK